MTDKKILITGMNGFLGLNAIKYFKSKGFHTYGVGRGDLCKSKAEEIGLDFWVSRDITIDALTQFQQKFDVIIHCGGSGSVGFSIKEPYFDFQKTVVGTLEVLEYIRLYNPEAHLIYPSSPAIQGEHPQYPILEKYKGKPVSPYGYHKKITEDLCSSYSEQFNLKISIIRLFSVYGVELKKQILWDAYCKIKKAKEVVEFWGTGEEIRDFIHIDDVMYIISILLEQKSRFMIVNGGTGQGHTIRSIVEKIRKLLNKTEVKIIFNEIISQGNPNYYCADMTELNKLGVNKMKSLDDELHNYIIWADFKGHK